MAQSRQPHVVVLTGAGISAESGLGTFRGAGGLWHKVPVQRVATPEAWERDPALVLDFYNHRRKALLAASPNRAHLSLVELEAIARVSIVTQNVDDLHERAGSSSVLHLHGELRKARSTADERLIYQIEGSELNSGDLCELGSQLRPHVVWFGEEVPLLPQAARIVATADVFMVVGTSLEVYPAAGLVFHARPEAPIYVVDPAAPRIANRAGVTYLAEPATSGVPKVVETLRRAGD